MQSLSEPLEFIKAIHEANVKYLLIGRRAIIAYGGPVQTMDYDIFIDGSPENTSRLLAIAKTFGLYPSLPKEKIANHFKFRLENDYAIDIFRAKSFTSQNGKTYSFSDLYKRRNVAKGETKFEVNLPSIDDLIALKKLRSNPKDIEDIKYLKAIKKEKS